MKQAEIERNAPRNAPLRAERSGTVERSAEQSRNTAGGETVKRLAESRLAAIRRAERSAEQARNGSPKAPSSGSVPFPDSLGVEQRNTPAPGNRFGVDYGVLYPFIGTTVRTPEGEGILLQVLAGKAVVLLEHSEDRTRRFDWRDVEAVT